MIEWEEIKQNHALFLYRAKIFGGWLVRTTDDVISNTENMTQGYEWRSSITFVPDLNHDWRI